MKIIYLIHQFFPEYYTGTEKFVLNLSSMIQKTGQNIKIITYSFYNKSLFNKSYGEMLYKEFVYESVPIIALRHNKIPDNINTSLENKEMTNMAKYLLSKEEPDIVHVGHPMRISEFIPVCKELNIPYIFTLTDFWLLCPKVNLVTSNGNLCAGPEGGTECKEYCPELPNHLIAQRCKATKDMLLGAKRVISPSNFLANIFKKELDNPDIMILNHGISYSKIRKNCRNPKKGDKLIFCYAGSLNSHKGVHLAIEALKGTDSNNIVLKIFGSGVDQLYTNRLHNLAKNDKRIEFFSVYSESEVGDIMSNVDAVIVPSLCYESYSFVLHEALACNTPVICSNIGGMIEKISDGVNGFIFPPGDIESLRNIIKKIISNPEILDEIKKNIRNLLIPTIEQEAYAYYRLYSDILKK